MLKELEMAQAGALLQLLEETFQSKRHLFLFSTPIIQKQQQENLRIISQ